MSYVYVISESKFGSLSKPRTADFITLKKSICHAIIVLHAFKQCWSKVDKERLGNNLVENAKRDIFCKRPGIKQSDKIC